MNDGFTIKTAYRHDEAVIRLQGAVTEGSIIALCDEVNLALDYYYYPRIVLQIDSPGGSAKALDYYIQQLYLWRQRQVCVATEALTSAYSAAAIMLSLGDIGHRRAYSTSRLLYHNPRIMTEGGSLDARTLIDAYRQLTSLNDSMTDHLAKHVYEQKVLQEVTSDSSNEFRWKKILTLRSEISLAEQSPVSLFTEIDCGEREHLELEQVKLAYTTLNQRDLVISAEHALRMLLIDTIIDAPQGGNDR